jgi:glucosamine kinase
VTRATCPPACPLVKHWLGVDGGGTGTRARLQDAAGRTLGEGEAGPSALSQGVVQAWLHVQQAVAAAFANAGLPPAAPAETALGLGLSGAGVRQQRQAFLAADPGYARCVLDNDGVTQLMGALAGGPGIVVASGTGSVATARLPDGRIRQAGGWGFPVGDEGSGAWLGLKAMQHTQAVLDGRDVAGALSHAVMYAVTQAVAADAPALLAWCAQAGARAYAGLAPLVFTAADEGADPCARTLVQAAADELAALVRALQAGCPAPLPVVASGSIGARLVPWWPAALRERVVAPAGDSCAGALRLLRDAVQRGQATSP